MNITPTDGHSKVSETPLNYCLGAEGPGILTGGIPSKLPELQSKRNGSPIP